MFIKILLIIASCLSMAFADDCRLGNNVSRQLEADLPIRSDYQPVSASLNNFGKYANRITEVSIWETLKDPHQNGKIDFRVRFDDGSNVSLGMSEFVLEKKFKSIKKIVKEKVSSDKPYSITGWRVVELSPETFISIMGEMKKLNLMSYVRYYEFPAEVQPVGSNWTCFYEVDLR